MKIKSLISILLFCATSAVAQTVNDPVIMKIAGQDIRRSEFEYSYNKNNSDGVIDKKSVPEYVDLFINYKLKVQAALDEHMDTLSSYKGEFRQYRDMQIRPALINDADVEEEAHKIYDGEVKRIGPDGLILPAHIFVKVSPDDKQDVQDKQKSRIDSIYNAITGSNDQSAKFDELARYASEDPGAAQHDGKIGWITHGQTFDEFDKAAFALKKDEISKPFKSPVGWHIIKMTDRKPIDPYDSLRASIMRFIDARKIRENIINRKVKEEADSLHLTADEVMDNHAAAMQSKDSDLDNLVREYHDGLLLYEIENREVWDKGAKDEAGLENYFKTHQSAYTWDAPRYKGMVYHVKNKKDLKAVAKCVKGLKFSDWNEKLRATFNGDSIIRIRVEKGIFKQGDNAIVDSCVYKVCEDKTKHLKDYPIDAVYGKMLKAPEEMSDVRSQVTADYQSELEKAWVAELRKRYPVQVYDDVVKTVKVIPAKPEAASGKPEATPEKK